MTKFQLMSILFSKDGKFVPKSTPGLGHAKPGITAAYDTREVTLHSIQRESGGGQCYNLYCINADGKEVFFFVRTVD